jgi:hypothetical protein
MPKRAKRIPVLRAGRRVRWTFEVSADVGRDGVRTKKASTKRQRAITARRVTPVATTTSTGQPVAPLLTSSVTHPAVPGRRAIHLQLVTLAMVIMFVVAITLSRRPSAVAAAAADVQPERPVQSSVALVPQPIPPVSAPTAARVAAAAAVAPRPISESSAKAAVLKTERNRIAEAASPTAAVPAIVEALSNEDSTTKLAAAEAISPEPAAVSPDPVGPGAVTITGCLERSGNEDRFRLADTEGTDALKSRSWRSGFLRKRSTSVALVDPPDARTLKTQVGQRVAATGLLTNRELRVTSLRVIGPRCD